MIASVAPRSDAPSIDIVQVSTRRRHTACAKTSHVEFRPAKSACSSRFASSYAATTARSCLRSAAAVGSDAAVEDVRTAASTVKVMPCSFCAGPKSAPLNECATCATSRASTPRVASCPRTSSTSSVAWPTSALTFTRSNGGAIDAFTRCAVCSSQSDAPSSSDGGATGTCHQPSTTAVCSAFVAFEAHGVGPDATHRSRVLPWCAAGSSYEKRPPARPLSASRRKCASVGDAPPPTVEV